MNRIPLAQRIARLKEGKPSDPSITNDRLIETVTHMPLYDYMNNSLLSDLARDLEYEGSFREIGEMTYGQVATLIHDMWNPADRSLCERLGSAMIPLLKPYYVEYQRRKKNA